MVSQSTHPNPSSATSLVARPRSYRAQALWMAGFWVLMAVAMTLQPLVQNAIKHGIEGQLGQGIVRIAARRDGEALVIEVADNGRGLDVHEGRPYKEGVGLSNTRSRIEALGAGVGSLQLRSPTDGGLVAEVRLPWRPASGPGAPNSSLV